MNLNVHLQVSHELETFQVLTRKTRVKERAVCKQTPSSSGAEVRLWAGTLDTEDLSLPT